MATIYFTSGLLLALGLVLIFLKPAFLLAGYNTMSKEKQAKWDEKALCVFLGWLLVVEALLLLAVELLARFKLISNGAYGGSWLIFIVLMLAGVVYVNVSKRFRRNGNPDEFDSPFCDVKWVPADRVVLLAWKRFCSHDDYRAPALFALKLLQENSGSNLVIDARHGFEDDPADVDWGFKVLLPAMAQTNCRVVAFVMEGAAELEAELDLWTKEFLKYFQVHKASSYAEAVARIQSKGDHA